MEIFINFDDVDHFEINSNYFTYYIFDIVMCLSYISYNVASLH